MQETIRFTLSNHDLSIKFDQEGLLIKVLMLLIKPETHIPIEQISYIKLRKEFVFFGKQGFEINYRKHPKGALLAFFFISKQPQAWIDAFSAAGITIIPST